MQSKQIVAALVAALAVSVSSLVVAADKRHANAPSAPMND